MADLARLNIGCGYTQRGGRINCDIFPGSNVDVVFDAQKKWPFEDNSASEVLATHVLEHLSDPMGFFKEAWRVLVPGGRMVLYLPYGPSDDGITDVTHLKAWTPAGFCMLQPGYYKATGNPQNKVHEDYPYRVDFVACHIDPRLRWLCRWPIRYWGLDVLWYLWNGHKELVVNLTTLKTPEQIEEFKKERIPNMVYVSQFLYQYEWEGRQPASDEQAIMVNFNKRKIGVLRHGQKL